jgi:uridylate kinase
VSPGSEAERSPYCTRNFSLHYNDVIQHNLKVMDQSAFILARDYSLPIHVFNFDKPGSMKDVCEGKNVGTIISSQSTLVF